MKPRPLLSDGPMGNTNPYQQPVNNAADNKPSAIPLPSTSINKQTIQPKGASRMSLAVPSQPSARRTSTMQPPSIAGPSLLRHSNSQEGLRRSTMASNGLMSGTRGDAGFYGRQSQANRNPPGR